jgi:signal transduction histidine kinase
MAEMRDADGSGEAEVSRFAFGVRAALGPCGCADAASDFFFIDADTGELRMADGGSGSTDRGRIAAEVLSRPWPVVRDTLIGPARVREGSGGRLMIAQVRTVGDMDGITTIPQGRGRALVFTQIRSADARRVYGFTMDVPRLLRPLVEAEIAGSALLPPSLVAGATNGELLAMDVRTAEGETIFRSEWAPVPALASADTLDLGIGLLAMRTAVRPEIAGRLVIGGLPASRLPLLLGSLGLTLLLLVLALRQLQRQQAFFRARADFVSGVSHELRTPLAQIRLFTDLLASGRLDPARRERSLRIMAEETKRLTYLVDNVLRFSREERGGDRVAPVPTDIGALVEEIAADFSPLARSRGVEIRVRTDAGLRAQVDPDAIRQVLLNLLDNAVKYGPSGQRVEVTALAEGESVRIEVADEGPGIPPRDRQRIWEPYQRLGRTVERASGGSGIGLAVVRELVGLHGGEAFVQESAVGARFVVRLPGRIAAAPDGGRVPVGLQT